MELDPSALPASAIELLTERHLATLTVLRPDGTPQVTPVGMTYDQASTTARVITWAGAYKSKLLAASGGGPVALCQVDGGRWLTLYGNATVTSDPERVATAVARYQERFRPPKQRDDRVVIEVAVDRVSGDI